MPHNVANLLSLVAVVVKGDPAAETEAVTHEAGAQTRPDDLQGEHALLCNVRA